MARRFSSFIVASSLGLPACADELGAGAGRELEAEAPASTPIAEPDLVAAESDRPSTPMVMDEDGDAREILVGDFDGDGRADIFRADYGGNGRQYNLALINDGDGWQRWPGPGAILLGGDDRQLYIGDFDGDGRDDVFRADQGGNGYQYNTWFAPDGNGGWSWRSGPQVPLGGGTRRVYIGDFDGDGRDDVLLAFDDSTEHNRIYRSDGSGGWTEWSSGLDFWLGGGDREVVVADFDGDGDDDLLRADGSGDGTQYNRLMLSNGDGTWTSHDDSPNRQLRRNNRALYVGDFDGDGAADLLRADWNGDGTQWNAVLPSNGNGTWGYWNGIDLRLDPDNRSVHIGDFDGDGRDDILVADWNGNGRDDNRVILTRGNGSWEVWEQPKFWLGGPNREVHVASFDADARADILRADWNGDGKIYNRIDRSDGDGTWTRGPDPAIWLGGTQGVGLPEIPALARAVTGYEDGEYVAPHIPPVRTSNDGRIGVYLKPHGGRELVLITPEALDDHFEHQAPGVPVFSAQSPHVVDNALFDGAAQGNAQHLSLCDGSSVFPGAPGENDYINPTTCGANDCYELHTVTTVDVGGDRQVWATPLTVEVQDPKTASAEIVGITTGTPIAGPTWSVSEAFEPMFTADGRLFVFRVSNSAVTWNDADGQPRSGNYDMVYAVIPEGADPCDVTALDGPYPVSHAPFHPGLGDRYGFAVHQFRDPEGNPIADGIDIQGTYPWIDRQGRNLFFPAISATLHYDEGGVLKTRYRARCVPGVDCDLNPSVLGDVEAGGETRGIVAMGLWTRGKMVLLDGDFANTDYGLNQEAAAHRELQLYDPYSAPAGDQLGWVRLGTGRDNVRTELPTHGVANTTFIDSLENLHNHEPNMVPATPRDVVWTLNSGRASADVAFDDYLSAAALILVDGNASLTHDSPGYARDGSLMHYHDGFHETGGFSGTGFGDEVRVQNAATGSSAAVPSYGVGHGNVRIEPAAIGGIVGKGLWLDGYSGFAFELDAPAPGEVFASVFVDLRPMATGLRRVLRFPDGSELQVNRTRVRYRTGGVDHNANLPVAITADARTWTHLAVYVAEGGQTVEIHVDGFLLRSFATAAHTPLIAGTLELGSVDGSAAARGWIDDFAVIQDRPDPETICNHARGTLVGFSSALSGSWADVADAYPSSSHAALSATLQASSEPSYDRYACVHDYDLDHGILAEELPAGTTSIRSSVLFPEGPLAWDSPRPDSSTNEFCLACHQDGEPQVLSIDALTPSATVMQDDPRRQPMQASRSMGGWIPAGMFGVGEPASDLSGVLGTLIDQWLH